MNYIIAFVFYPLFLLSLRIPDIGYFNDIVTGICAFTFTLSISFFVFNLLPFYPLDGFRVYDVFSNKTSRVYHFLRHYGQYVLMACLLFSILADFTGIYRLNFLGNAINFLSDIISKPITLFWDFVFFG